MFLRPEAAVYGAGFLRLANKTAQKTKLRQANKRLPCYGNTITTGKNGLGLSYVQTCFQLRMAYA